MNWTFFIDQPAPGLDFPDQSQKISGWISAGSRVSEVRLSDAAQVSDIAGLVPRNDVEKANRGKFHYHIGFESGLPLAGFAGLVTLNVRFANGECAEQPLNLPDICSAKLAKFEKVTPLLVCPECLFKLDCSDQDNDATRSRFSGLQCGKCGAFFRYNGNSIDFLTDEFKSRFSITPTGNVSCWDYDGKILEIIGAAPDSLFLDCGAGWRAKNYPNVINYEIQDYPSTDVLGVGEKLPFATDSFDGVFSVAVLEHVMEPALCAREMARVLKPGGLLFCAAAFLSPVHAYPNHYYNMTSQGLQSLFQELEIMEAFVPPALHPMKTLGWILRSYIDGLPERLQGKFMSMRVGELAQMDDFQKMEKNQLVTELSEEKRFELANGTAILARKR